MAICGRQMWLLALAEAVGCMQGHHKACILTANQHDSSSDVETFAFLQGEQLDNEHDKRNDGENDREDHKGLHGFEGSCEHTGNRFEKVGLSLGIVHQGPAIHHHNENADVTYHHHNG